MESKHQEFLKGIPVSAGIAKGTAYVVAHEDQLALPRRAVAEAEVGPELAKFESALRQAESTLETLLSEVRERIGASEAEIFSTQLVLLRDPAFLSAVTRRVSGEHINIEAALLDVIEHFSQVFAAIPDAYLRERAGDVRDVGRRVLAVLSHQQASDALDLPEGSIVVAPELPPSTTARLDLRRARAVLMERGGRTSHASILLRSLRIPAVVGLSDVTKRIATGDTVIVDGMSGAVFIHPGEAVDHEYARLAEQFEIHETALNAYLDCPAVTRDGTTIQLLANIGKSADAEAAALFRADGIGLFRTEFSFLVRDRPPSVEEHLQIYTSVAERMHPGEVVIRVLDVGSDKSPAYLGLPQETNPALGLRGTRLLLRRPDLLEPQLRAILEVSARHPVSILFPGITGLEDILEAKRMIEAVKARLHEEGRPFNPNLRVGAMIEVPSAAIMARRIAREVDFLSLGTNDLTQHTLAADRGSPEMAGYYRAIHPAVLCMIRTAVEGARAEGKSLTICGQMAGNPARTELLLGLGLRRLSVTPGEILEVKRMICSVDLGQAEKLASAVLELPTVEAVEAHLHAAGTRVPSGAESGQETAADPA